MHLKMSLGKWRPFCLGLNVLKTKRRMNTFLTNFKYHIFYQRCNPFLKGCPIFRFSQSLNPLGDSDEITNLLKISPRDSVSIMTSRLQPVVYLCQLLRIQINCMHGVYSVNPMESIFVGCLFHHRPTDLVRYTDGAWPPKTATGCYIIIQSLKIVPGNLRKTSF